MRRPALLLAPPLFALALMALPAAARAQADRPLTPRPPPTAVLPKATPVHAEPKGKAPAGLAPLLPLPVVPAPLSPVFVPGEPPPAAPAPVASVAAPPPPAPPAPPPAEGKAPPVAKPPPAAVAEAPKPAEKKPGEAKPASRTVYAKEGIYIRVSPGRNSRVLDTLEEGESAELLPDKSPEEGWSRIARNGKPVGWVSSRFLAERSSGQKPDGRKSDGDGCSLPSDFPSRRSVSIAEGSAVRVLADANVRQSPACNAKVLDVLEEGETVTVTGSSGTWYRVARRGRTLGYVSGLLLGEARGR